MHKELSDLLTECKKPTHLSHAKCKQKLAPVAELVADAQMQVARARQLLVVAELAEPDPARQGELERLHQTIGWMEKHAPDLINLIRQFADTAAQLERYGAEIEAARVGRGKA